MIPTRVGESIHIVEGRQVCAGQAGEWRGVKGAWAYITEQIRYADKMACSDSDFRRMILSRFLKQRSQAER